MTRSRTITGARIIALVTLTLSCAVGVSVLGHAPARAMETLKADRFYPQGRTLLFSLYSVTEPELSSVSADGFTAIGPYYGNQDQALEHARKARLPYLHTIGPRRDFEQILTGSSEEAEALDALISNVTDASKHPDVAAWYLANEELRYWRPDEMQWLKRVTEAIHAHDPGQRPIMMYEPNHRTADALGKTAPYLNVVTKGAYANLVGMKYDRSWVRWSVQQAVEAAASSGTVPVAVLLMVRDQETAVDIAAIRSWARHDVYLSLMTGAKGILVFSGANRRPGFERDFRDFYEGYASAARELNGELNLAEVFLFGKPQDAMPIEILAGPEDLSFEYLGSRFSYPSVSTVTRYLHDKAYLLLINSANEAVTVNIGGLPEGVGIRNVLSDEQTESAGDLRLELAAYEFRAFFWPM